MRTRIFHFMSLIKDHPGMHYAVRIFAGTTLLWLLVQTIGDQNPLWAIISLIIVTEPKMDSAWLAFKARIINTIAGCLVGLIFLMFIYEYKWLLPISLTVTSLISTCIIRMPLGWRVAPITTAIIMAAGMAEPSRAVGMAVALHRTMEVFLGSAMALLVTWVMGKIWAPADAHHHSADTKHSE